MNRLTKWLVTNTGDGGTIHDYTYQYDGNSNRTQIIADPLNSQDKIAPDPSQGIAHSNENDLAYNAVNELGTILAYGPQYPTPSNPSTTTYSYDAAGNQTGNDGAGDPGKALSITYQGSNQTDSITDTNQEPVSPTWAGAGQSERVAEQWTHNGTNNKTTYTYGLLGLAGTDGPNDSNPSPNPVVASWIVRDPSGRPIAQRYATGSEYYYLFDGQGNVVALEDPGTIQAAYDYCPTGNNAALPGGQLTAVGLGNPLRQGSVPYDDGTKDYFNSGGCIVEDASGVCTQQAGMQYGDIQPPNSTLRRGVGTGGVCFSVSAGVFLYGAVSVCGLGELGSNNGGGFTLTVSGGRVTGAAVTATSGVAVSNAPTVEALAGSAGTVGFAVGEGVVGGADVTTNGRVTEVSGQVGVGAILGFPTGPFEIHGGYSQTYVFPFRCETVTTC